MPKTSDLTKKDILHIAKLANLPILEENIEAYRKQLSETVSYIENMSELDTKGVEPTSHSTNMTNVFFEDGTKNERLLSQEEATSNAKLTKKGKFAVKRLMG